MLSIFTPADFALRKTDVTDLEALPEKAVWIDLVKPTAQEDHAVERLAGIAVPTREDMQEIEISSRLYIENGARYMTATLMCNSDSDMPKTTAVTFILAGHRLVTVRYDEPKPFALVEHKLARSCAAAITGEMVLMELLQGHARAAQDHAARRGLADRPLLLSLQQDHLCARRHARCRQPRAEQHHQIVLGDGGGLDAADPDRLDLRHEFQGDAGIGMAARLRLRAILDGAGSGAAVFSLQMEEVAVREAALRPMEFCFHRVGWVERRDT